MNFALLTRRSEAAAGASLRLVQRNVARHLQIGPAEDAFEREADHVADAVATGKAVPWSIAAIRPQAPVQRKCDCGGEGQCEECTAKSAVAQRKPSAPGAARMAPTIVADALRSPGEPLDAGTRAFFESRFARGFGKVRVHTDATAAASAQAISALAYTVGHDIAFGPGQYAPDTQPGRRLLAHELTHVLHQESDAGAPVVQRQLIPVPNAPPIVGPFGEHAFGPPPPPPAAVPCLTSTDCAKPIPGSSWDFSRKADIQEQQTQAELAKDPVKAKAAGAVRPAASLKSLMNAQDPGVLSGVYDVVVNPAIGDAAGAQSGGCDLASPKPTDPAASCIEVPNLLEVEAQQFNSGAKTVDGQSSYDWLTDTLEIIRHEKTHITFGQSPTVGRGVTFNVQSVFAYSPDIYQWDLDEMNSILSEFPVEFRRTMASPTSKDKTGDIKTWLINYINNTDEGLRGTLKKLRCIASCNEVSRGVKKVFSAQSSSWTDAEKTLFRSVVTDPAQGLDWPP